MTATEFQYELISLQDNLKRYASSLTCNNEDAKDLVQETYLKALTYRNYYKDNTNMKAWVFTIMKNSFINNYRKIIKHNRTFNLNETQFLMSNNLDSYNPESQYSHSEISKKVDELHWNYRIPFQMHTSGYKYKEIAKNLNLKIGTVKSRIFLSRKQLMNLLNG